MADFGALVSLYERVLSDDEVEDAVMATLQKWLASELSELERRMGLDVGYHARPRTWVTRNDFEKFPEEMLPMTIVISAGLIDEPVKDGRWKFRAEWGIGVATVATSIDQAQSRRNAYRLGAAVRGVFAHHQSLDLALDGTVRGVRWLDSTNDELPPEGSRTIFVTKQVFAVEVDNVLTVGAGPATPEGGPPPDPIDSTDTPPPDPEWGIIPDVDHVITTWTQEPRS